ncbi:Proline-rich basic protein 1 [Sciurus carolinensis]|uniref:Proline-rich basic protein 1 n=1 Tax=Sciurus carolinensis TaxID=30640 RepID=A0AA41NB56_SCICA|nr:proline-rich basic protein 1 [Sciurus carolinensis]MBZ3886737.1 Proline-rich basic protein 1 [Sciurus carolinensis]
MLTALVPQELPGLPRWLPAAPARRQDSSGSSGSYHTAPDSPEPPDVGPDAEDQENWPCVAPRRGVGAQPLLSVSAQNSSQQIWSGSSFHRGPGSGPPPPQPQLRMLPSGEMEVIFGARPLLSHSDAEDCEVQQLTAPTSSNLSLPEPVSPSPIPSQPQSPDGGSRWATYLELRPRGPSPRGPSPVASAQFECVEVALEEEPTAPGRSRTVPKRQIELRPRPRSPSRAADAPRPQLFLRTGSLDESMGRLQAAAGLVQTALARKLDPTAPASSSATFRLTERPQPRTRETSGSTHMVLEESRSRLLHDQDNSARARAPRPWPSLRERAIRRDKPTPGTEPLGPVSSSIFLQSEEKISEARNQEPKTRFPRESPNRTSPRAHSPSFKSRVPSEIPSRSVRPRSPSPSWQAPNGTERGPHYPFPWDRTVRRVSSPSLPEASSAWENQNPSVEETSSRRTPSPPTLSQWNQGAAGARSSSPEVPSHEAPQPAVGEAVGRGTSRSPLTLYPWEATDLPVGTRSPSPQETWVPMAQGSSIAFTREAMNGVTEELATSTPAAPGTPELTEVQSTPTRKSPNLVATGSEPSPKTDVFEPPRSYVVGSLDADARPEGLCSEVASGRSRVTIPRPRDVRKIVKTTYAPSFPSGSPGSGLPGPPSDSGGEEGDASKTPELQVLGSPAPAHYTSVFLKDFLPVVQHPYESPEPSLDRVPPDASQPNGVLRRRAENSTAKPFARTEIRLPGALALGGRPERISRVLVHSLRGENRDAEAQRLVPDGEGRTSPLGGARTSPQRSSIGPSATRPSRPCSPQACPNSSPGIAPKLEAPAANPEPASSPPLRESQALASMTAPPQPRAASAPPTDRSQGLSQGMRRPLGATHPGKVLVDPETGRYYFVEAPRQPRLRLLFDPESGQYVEVLLPHSSPRQPRHIYTPLALGPGLYPPAYGPIPSLSLPPSPGLPALGSSQLPWASEAGPLDGMYYLPMSGTPSPAPPLLLCAPPANSDPTQPSKGSVFPL